MKKSGITLVEILVVITIIAIVFAIGLGMFSSGRVVGIKAAKKEIISLVQYARQKARRDHSNTFVIFDIESRKYGCHTKKTLGLWHFEEIQDGKVKGALGYDLVITAGTIQRAQTGNGVFFKNGYALNEKFPAFAKNEGLSIDIDFVILEKDAKIFLEKENEYYVASDLTEKIRFKYGNKEVRLDDVTIPINKWCHFEMSLIENILIMRLGNYIQLKTVDFDLKEGKTGKLYIGSKSRPLSALIDEARVSSLIIDKELKLPDGVFFEIPEPPKKKESKKKEYVSENSEDEKTTDKKKTKKDEPQKKIVVIFDENGNLMQPFHKSDISFKIKSTETEEEIKIDMQGVVK